MSLKSELKNLHVKSFCKMPEDVTTCLVLGNLYNQNELIKNLKSICLLSPIEIENKNIDFFAKYETGSEEGVLALLLDFFSKSIDAKDYLDSLDIGYLSAESNVGEEEVEELKEKLTSPYLLVCEDLEFHENASNIAKLLSMLVEFAGFKIIYPLLDEDIKTNSLHIADEIEELRSFDGAVMYLHEKNKKGLLGSSQFALANRLQDNDTVLIKMKDDEFKTEFKISDELKGTIGLLGGKALKNSYAYQVSKVIRMER